MGAVLHTLNLRLSPDQLAFIVNDAADLVIVVDDTLLPVLEKFIERLRHGRARDRDERRRRAVGGALTGNVLRYEERSAGRAARRGSRAPSLTTAQAAGLC